MLMVKPALTYMDVISDFKRGNYLKIYDEMFSKCKDPQNIYLDTKKLPDIANDYLKDAGYYKNKILSQLSKKILSLS